MQSLPWSGIILTVLIISALLLTWLYSAKLVYPYIQKTCIEESFRPRTKIQIILTYLFGPYIVLLDMWEYVDQEMVGCAATIWGIIVMVLGVVIAGFVDLIRLSIFGIDRYGMGYLSFFSFIILGMLIPTVWFVISASREMIQGKLQ